MTPQPTYFSHGAPASPQTPGPLPESLPDLDQDQLPRERPPAPPRVPLWLQLLELSVRVVVRVYLGLILLALPWTHFWDDNHLLLFVPHLASIALSGAARGIVSGLGLLNIYIGIHDAFHYTER
jgi:hypothetical protein